MEGLSRDDFSEVFLFFDYDAHQTNLGKSDDVDVINQMLESFDNETENETNLKAIMSIMGHADISTTMDIYTHVTKEVRGQAKYYLDQCFK